MLRTCQTGVKLSSSTFPSMTHGAAPGRGQDAFSWLWTSGTCPVSPSCPTSLGPRGSGWPRGTRVGGTAPACPAPALLQGLGLCGVWLVGWLACKETRDHTQKNSVPPPPHRPPLAGAPCICLQKLSHS